MKFFIFVALVFLISNVGIAKNEWFVCKESSDCEVMEDACYVPIAIHEDFVDEQEEQNKKIRPLIQCNQYKGPSKDKYEAVCKDEKCTLKLEK